jgi:hypothetical protein
MRLPYNTARALAKETGQTIPIVRMQAERDDAVYLGGSVWRCLWCNGPLEAACPCCAPPACNCRKN